MSSDLEAGVTVVVPTFNRQSFLVQSLKDLLLQDHSPLEVLVVDQSPEPNAEALQLADQSSALSYHHVQFRGLPLARNFGWQKARFERIVFVDDDIRCGRDLVTEHLRVLAQPGVGVVAGGVDEVSNDRSGRIGDFSRWLAAPLGAFGTIGEFDVVAAKGCNFSTTRTILESVGGFDEALNVGAALHEETEFCLRVRAAGMRVRFNGKARLLHLAAPSGGCRVAKPREYVSALCHNRGILIRRHLRAFHYPTALSRLFYLGGAYARANRDLGVIWAGLGGCVRGLADGARAVRCSQW
jgi:GT2 family glycosyltransferase